MKLVVDANILIAALLKKAVTRELLLEKTLEFVAPEQLLKELKEIMQQVDLYGAYEVIPAIEKALEHKTFGAIHIKNIVAQNRAKRLEKPVTPLNLSKYPEIEELEVEPKDLNYYDKLFEKGGE